MAAAAIVAAAPAAAATFTWNFNNNLTAQTTGVGNYMTFSQTIGGETLNVRASAFSINSAGNTISAATVQRFGEGLGVLSSVDGNGSNSQHTVDNNGAYDFVLFQFSKTVSLGTGVLTPFTVANSYDNDASVFWGSTSTIAWNADITTANLPTFSGSTNINGTASTAAMNLNPTGATGNLWIVAASLNNRDGADGFKLNMLKSTPAVPEPATWAMMIAGFGLVGSAMRRRTTTGARALA